MFWTVTLTLLKGLGTTTEIFALTLLFSLPLGLVVAFGSMSKWQPFRFLLYGQEKPGAVAAWIASMRPLSALTSLGGLTPLDRIGRTVSTLTQPSTILDRALLTSTARASASSCGSTSTSAASTCRRRRPTRVRRWTPMSRSAS